MRKCIICLKNKDDSLFNEEHVFPASIGGNITIPILCSKCNSSLGEKVDKPFTNNNLILHFRNVLGVGRAARTGSSSSRTIRNPFQGLYTDCRGAKFRVSWQNNIPIPLPVRQSRFEYSEEKKGYIVTLTGLSFAEANNIDQILNEEARRKGLKFDKYTLEDKRVEQPDNLQVGFPIDNNSLVLGCAKIAYEVTCSVFPNYLNDPLAFLIRKSLKSGKLGYHLAKKLKHNHNLQDYFRQKFSKIPNINVFHHCILMEVIPKYGLVCAVRFFNQVYPITMSESFFPVKEDYELFIFNDSRNGIAGSNIIHEFPNIHIQLKMEGLSENIQNNIMLQHEGYFTVNDKIPVYEANGNELYDDLDKLCTLLIREESTKTFFVDNGIQYTLTNKEYYLKSQEGVLVKLMYVTPTRIASIQKLFPKENTTQFPKII